jgi:hypothetical protein
LDQLLLAEWSPSGRSEKDEGHVAFSQEFAKRALVAMLILEVERRRLSTDRHATRRRRSCLCRPRSPARSGQTKSNHDDLSSQGTKWYELRLHVDPRLARSAVADTDITSASAIRRLPQDQSFSANSSSMREPN